MFADAVSPARTPPGSATPKGSSSAPPGNKAPRARGLLLFCGLISLFFAVYPFSRAFFRVEVSYNEGWNLYNVDRLVHHLPLYPEAYGWQTNNYPMLSYAVLAALHRVTGEFLFTARMLALLSLLAVCVLAGLVVRRLGGSAASAWLTGLFLLGTFCTDAPVYVGADDPQMLAQAVFLLGLLSYVWRPERRKRPGWLLLSATLFVIAGNIKHNPVDFPLAVLLDLLWVGWTEALLFGGAGVALAAASVLLTRHFGGPYFLAQLLAPRTCTLERALHSTIDALGPMFLPVVSAAALSARRASWNPQRRIAALLFACSLLVGCFFSGGSGVSTNAFFSVGIATALCLGLGFDELGRSGRWTALAAGGLRLDLRTLAAATMFVWLAIPAAVAHVLNPIASLRQTIAEQQRFDAEIAIMKTRPSPQVCESLLRCFLAGQPYVYDPFNATRLIAFGKLDPQPLLDGLRQGRFGVVQVDQPLAGELRTERFPPGFFDALRSAYRPAFEDKEVLLFTPRANPTRSGNR